MDINDQAEIQKIIERIRKMLAMANDKANVHESAVAASMAEKLMRKYQLDMVDVVAPADMYGARDVNTEYEWTGRRAEQWKEWIATATAKLNECHVKYVGSKYSQNMGFSFVGVGPDPTVAAEIYKYLTTEVRRLGKVAMKGDRKGLNSFYHGAAHELTSRLAQMQRERASEFAAKASGTALVIHKQALIEQAYGEFAYGTSKTNVRYGDAYYAGRKAGAGINLSDQVTADKREQLK